MTRPGLADATELLRWADSLSARSELPRLVRRLILESGRGVTRVGFRAGEGVGFGDWDGTVRSTEATAHIPQGLSLWELSVTKSVKAKADRDYAKRASTPDDTPTAEASYVAVSLRRWANKDSWSSSKTSEARWREVRAYDVEDLETWLEANPVSHAWISEHLGLAPHGMVAAESWWESWSSATEPRLEAAMLLAGRNDEASSLKSRLAADPVVTTIAAASRDEALAFLAAVQSVAPDEEGASLWARTAFVDDVAAWRRLQDHSRVLVLIPRSESAEAEVTHPTRHHVIVPVPSSTAADIVLPPLNEHEAGEILKAAGLDEKRAESLARLGRRSLLTLRRQLAVKPELHRPAWAHPPVDRTVRGLLLVGTWDDRQPADDRIVEQMTGRSKDQLREELAALAAEGDPLIERVGSVWGLISRLDSFLQLRGAIQREDLLRLKEAVLAVLPIKNPALEMSPQDRWKASLEGKILDHSHRLREGLATTLALLGSYGGQIDAPDGFSGGDWADYVVGEVLAAANADSSGMVWASLEDVLPLLAEASPDKFLKAVRAGLRGSPPLLAAMFMDQETSWLSTHSPHTGLLWALEGLAWSPDHVGHVVDALARLAEIDPGGRLSNRPVNCIKEILSSWYPQNTLDVLRRLAVIDALRKRHPSIAWEVLLSTLPEQHAVALPIHEPRFRDWKPAQITVMLRDYWAYVEEIIARVLIELGLDSSRWEAIIEVIHKLPPASRQLVREQLANTIGHVNLEPQARTTIWATLHSVIGRHRQFADAPWALPAQEVDALEVVANSAAPDDPSVRHRYLFDDYMPDLGVPRFGDDRTEYETVLADLRARAVAEIVAEQGWKGVRDFARSTQYTSLVGVALANHDLHMHGEEMLELLDSEDASDRDFGFGYAVRVFEIEGWSWVEALLGQSPSLAAGIRARLLLATADYPRAWEVADEQGIEVAAAFWRSFRTFGLGADFPHAEYVSRRLAGAGRFAAAVDLLSLYLRGGTTSSVGRIIEALEEYGQHADADPEAGLLSQHDFTQLFDFIHESDPSDWQRVARLEWMYLDVLAFEGRLNMLHRLLAEDPAFFVDVISRVYRRRDAEADEAEEVDEQTRRIASRAYSMLSHWHRVPGTRDDGTIDVERLREWASAARQALRETDRLEVGDTHIGNVLAHSPPAPDGSWPPHEVAEVIEELDSDKVESGVRMGVVNKRGVTSRGLEDGGTQETDLAQSYREQADRIGDQWPRSAAILRDLAKSYERDARQEDLRAERFRKGMDV